MDWPRARSILLVAFSLVNLLLAYSLWGPNAVPALGQQSRGVQLEQVRLRLADRGLILPAGAVLPPPPQPMQFLRVEYRPDLNFDRLLGESYQGPSHLPVQPRGFEGTSDRPEPTLDPETNAVIYRPQARGRAALPVSLVDETEILQVAEEYLRDEQLMPENAYSTGVFVRDNKATVEFVPMFQGIPVFSGHIRVDLTARGVETVTQFWVQPIGYKEAAPKAVRPAEEALLRLAGHLERNGGQVWTILDVRLGYYAGRSLTVTVPDAISAWETVPVWRITLDDGKIYYINALNGELES